MRAAQSFESRFWRAVMFVPLHECWEWGGTITRNGYGVLEGPSRDRPRIRPLAHRFSWELHFGPIPAQLCVLHRCDNRACVNPAHLFLGTIADNNADMYTKGRGSPAGLRPMQGEAHPRPNRKLSVDAVREIRVSSEPVAALASRFGVDRETVRDVLKGRTWRWLP